MKIIQISPIPSVYKFKNKEDFCNRLIQEILIICKNNPLYLKSNKKLLSLSKYKNTLVEKNEKLDSLIEKSIEMKTDIINKISLLTDDNNQYRNNLLKILEKN